MKTINKITAIADIKELEKRGIEIIFEPQEEDLNPYDQMEKKEDADEICRRYDNGFLEAWFCAKVTVKYKDFEYDDYLGGCSYDTFKEFTNEENGYYMYMVNNCIDQINKDIQWTNADNLKHRNIQKAKNLLKPYGLYIVSSNQLHTL